MMHNTINTSKVNKNEEANIQRVRVLDCAYDMASAGLQLPAPRRPGTGTLCSMRATRSMSFSSAHASGRIDRVDRSTSACTDLAGLHGRSTRYVQCSEKCSSGDLCHLWCREDRWSMDGPSDPKIDNVAVEALPQTHNDATPHVHVHVDLRK